MYRTLISVSLGFIAYKYNELAISKIFTKKLPYPKADAVFLDYLIRKHGLEVEDDDWIKEGE